jgi:hypothetical protein
VLPPDLRARILKGFPEIPNEPPYSPPIISEATNATETTSFFESHGEVLGHLDPV